MCKGKTLTPLNFCAWPRHFGLTSPEKQNLIKQHWHIRVAAPWLIPLSLWRVWSRLLVSIAKWNTILCSCLCVLHFGETNIFIWLLYCAQRNNSTCQSLSNYAILWALLQFIWFNWHTVTTATNNISKKKKEIYEKGWTYALRVLLFMIITTEKHESMFIAAQLIKSCTEFAVIWVRRHRRAPRIEWSPCN